MGASDSRVVLIIVIIVLITAIIATSTRYESCETQPCKPVSDYRLEQGRAFNGNNFKIEDLPQAVKWVPKYSGISEEDQCKLYCRVEYSSAYYLLAASVSDGTPCGVDTFNKCIAGQCVKAGCDHRLSSDARLGEFSVSVSSLKVILIRHVWSM